MGAGDGIFVALMPPFDRTRPYRFRLAARVLLALHVGAVTVAPLVHARAEVLASERQFESTHSDRCPRIHVDWTCLLLTAHRLPAAAVRSAPRENPVEAQRVLPQAAALVPRHDGSGSRPIRAPPTR